MNDRLEQTINEGLKNFTKLEISKMEVRLINGLSWHGCKPKEAFKRCGMEDEYEDYNMACTFVHIRDWPFPSGLLTADDRGRKSAIQSEFNTILGWLANHLEDFVQYCPNTLSGRRAEKIKELMININNLQNNIVKNIMKDEYAELSEFIIISDGE